MRQLGIEMMQLIPLKLEDVLKGCLEHYRVDYHWSLKSAGITNIEDTNRFLKQVFLPEFNRRFCVAPQIARTAFIPWKPGNIELDGILCIQDQRIVNNDNTISHKGKTLQIPKDEVRYSYRKTKVKVHEYLDGRVAIFHSPRKLVEFSRAEATNRDNESLENVELLLKTFLYSSNFAGSEVQSNTVTL